ncbi:MAG: hypothetical protein HQL21_01830 [Candidatus Omnitrophica bacterium]|nr:hypothetical protein [Candidatus Omnitrophota bacterium]
MLESKLERRLIGEILIERRLVTLAQLDHAIEAQKTTHSGSYIGEILISLGYVSEIDIVTALVLQCHLPYISVSQHQIDPQVKALIPSQVAWKNRLIPLDRIGNILSVVMLNPLNEHVRQEVERLTKCQIATFISTKSEIETVLKRLYGEEER